MKKCYISLLLLLLLPIQVTGQTTQEVLLHFDKDEFEVITEDGLSYITSSKYSITHGTDTLLPALPIVNVYVLIGPEDAYSTHFAKKNETLLFNNITVPQMSFLQHLRTNHPSYINLFFILVHLFLLIALNLKDHMKWVGLDSFHS